MPAFQTVPPLTVASEATVLERFRELADIEEEISARAAQPLAPDALARAAASLERALAALAAGVDRTAYALHDAPRAGARRAISWRLHGPAGALRRCRELAGVVQEAVERARPRGPRA